MDERDLNEKIRGARGDPLPVQPGCNFPRLSPELAPMPPRGNNEMRLVVVLALATKKC